MNENDMEQTGEEGDSKRKSDTAQSRKTRKGKKGFNSCAVLQMQ